MNRLDKARRVAVVKALVEGNSIRATVRLTGVAKNTVVKLLVELAEKCVEYHDANVRNLACQRIQCDEIWSFIGAEEDHPERQDDPGAEPGRGRHVDLDGDRRRFEALRVLAGRQPGQRVRLRDHVGHQEPDVTSHSTDDGPVEHLPEGRRSRVRRRCRLCDAPEDLRRRRRWALLPSRVHRLQEGRSHGHPGPEAHQHVLCGAIEPLDADVHAPVHAADECLLTEVENHAAAVALYFFWYNFGRVHQTLRVTPAMEAGVPTTSGALKRSSA